MWLFIAQGLAYGFAAASQPGPFQTYLISQSLSRGWRRTLPAALAPLVSDGPIIVLCLVVLSELPAWMERGLYIVGGVFVIYLGYGACKACRFFVPVAQGAAGERQSILKAALMNLLSPGPYLFWSLVSGPILMAGWRSSPGSAAGFLLAFYLALVGGLAAVILVFGLAARMGPRVSRAMLGISGLALLVFGVFQLFKGLD